MRRGLLFGAGIGAIDAGVVFVLDWALRKRGSFGWYSYSPTPHRYVGLLPSQHAVNGSVAAALIVVALAVVNMAAVAAYGGLDRRRTATR